MQKIFFLILVFTALLSCKTSLIVHDIKVENIPNCQNISTVDSLIVNFVQPYRALVDQDMQEVIAESMVELIKKKPESLLTNYMADILLDEGKMYASKHSARPIPDLAYLNYGGLRTDLPKGKITVGKIYELMPFENEMVLLRISGTDLYAMAEMIARKGGDSVAGIRLKIKDNQVYSLEVNNKPVSRSVNYWLVTNDYVANGGDDMTMLLNRSMIIKTGIKLRECFIQHMRNQFNAGRIISPKLDGRISYE